MAKTKDEIFNELVDALLEEFQIIRISLRGAMYTKHKPQLWNNLFRCAETLRELLLAMPERTGIEDWMDIIEEKAPKKFIKVAKNIVKSTGKVVKTGSR